MAKNEPLYIQYGTTRIPFQLQYSKRRTLGISVSPDRRVIITAPQDSSREKVLEKLEARAGWISKQLRHFERLDEKLPRRHPEYVSGETFYFLGRKYRLKVVVAKAESVERKGRYIWVNALRKSDQKRIAALLQSWYRQQAKEIFHERLRRHGHILRKEKLGLNQLLIRRLTKRWGSCTEKENVLLNLSLVQAPVQCIDYVMVHEICHLKYLNHGPKFYRLQDRYMPDWEKWKKRLEEVPLMD